MKRALGASLVALVGCLSLAPTHAADLRAQVNAYRAAHEAEIVGRLDALTRLPSVAARPQALVATADWLEHELKVRGSGLRLRSIARFTARRSPGSC